MTILNNKMIRTVFAIGALLFANSSLALIQGGTNIENTVEVNYSDAGGVTVYTATDTVTVQVREILEFEWRNYTSGLDIDAGDDATYSTETSPALVLDLANIGNASDSLTIYPYYDTAALLGGSLNTLAVYECTGDGTVTDNGVVGDDLSCVTALTFNADNAGVDSFAFGIDDAAVTNTWDATGTSAENVTIPITTGLDDTTPEIVAGDLVIFDDGTTVYEVIAVFEDESIGGDEDYIVVDNHDGALDVTIPGLVQEVQRFKWYGDMPTLDTTDGDTHINLVFEMDAKDSDAEAADGVSADEDFCTGDASCADSGTDNSDLDDRVDTDADAMTIAVLGPDITITKYVGPTTTTPASLTTVGQCDTRDFDGSGATYDFYGDHSGVASCEVQDIEDDEVLRYVLSVNNRAGGLDSPLDTARDISNIHVTSGGNDCFTAAANTCVGRAFEVVITDTYPELTTLNTSVLKIETSCDSVAWSVDATGDEDNTTDTYPDTADDGRTELTGGTITWYVDDVTNTNSNGSATGDDSTDAGGTVDPAQEVCILFEVSL